MKKLLLILAVLLVGIAATTTTTIFAPGTFSGALFLQQANSDQFSTDATGKLIIKDSALTTNNIVKDTVTLKGTSTFLQMIASGGSGNYKYFDLYNGGSTVLLRRKTDDGVTVLETPIGFSSSGLAIGSALLADSGLTVGGGAKALKILSAAAELDFGSIVTNAVVDLTITVTGADTNSVVLLGLPAAANASVVFNAFVSATNTVTVRAANISTASVDPATGSYRATVINY